MALACISGWPDEPDSPLHSFGGAGTGATAATAGAWAVTATGEAFRPTGMGGCRRSGCATPELVAPSSIVAPSARQANVVECFNLIAVTAREKNAHQALMSSAPWPYPIIGTYWAKIWLSER
jgi:hypothetical protein